MPLFKVSLIGGFGNWMFQVAFFEYLKEKYHANALLHLHEVGKHSNTDLMSTVFVKWKENTCLDHTYRMIFKEFALHPCDDYIKNAVELPDSVSVYILGFFQNYNYITSSFLNKLCLPSESLARHPDIHNTVFIHIRGGDYIGDRFYDIPGMDEYYEKAIQQFPEDTKFSLFTNDIPYMKTKKFLENVSYDVIEENEVDSMFLMSKCKGGICANSTFSWWGAFLNRNRKLILPSKWIYSTTYYTGGIYFPEATVIDLHISNWIQ
jgi:hypothetical protein